MKNYQKGFTLVEMLVVVLIIGILAAIAVPQYQKFVAKANLAQIISLVKSLKQAEEVYFLSHGKYATDLSNLDVLVNDPDISCIASKSGTNYNYVMCGNNKFVLLAYIDQPNIECAAKTQDIDSALAYACRDFTKSTSFVVSWGSCRGLISPCTISVTTEMPF